jgi:hypothetical protein
VALEQSSGALVYQLSQYPHLWLCPVHPATAAHYRRAFYPSGSKSDPADAGLLLELVVHHRDRLRRLAPDTRKLVWCVCWWSNGGMWWMRRPAGTTA